MQWWKSIPLHHKILGGLILGALFGALFNISKYELEVRHRVDGTIQTSNLQHWLKVEFLVPDGTPLGSYGPEDQLKIIQHLRTHMKEKKGRTDFRVTPSSDAPYTLPDVQSVEKVRTIAVIIKPIGTIFIRLLMFVAIPLVLASLIVGAASLGDIRHVGRLGGKTMLFYLCTITTAITVGLT